MNTPMKTFDFNGAVVRTMLQDGEPWFIAADVCAVLDIRNNRDALAGLDVDEKGVGTADTLGGRQQMAIINESGLYSLVLRSRKPEAKAFKRWVTRDVLPAIRKTGGYGLAGTAFDPNSLSRMDIIRLALAAEEEKAVIAAALEAAAPAIAYHERFVIEDDVLTVKAWGAQFGLTEPQAREKLLAAKVIYQHSLGERWSASKHRREPVVEYRAYAKYLPWFDLRPQHNAPRHHNGQVRQTLYIRQEHALALGGKLGLTALPVQDAILPAVMA